MSQNQHIFWVFVVLFLIFDHLTKYRVEGGQFPLDITYFRCVSESSVSFPFGEVQLITRFNHLVLMVLTGMLDSTEQNIPLFEASPSHNLQF